MRTVLLLMSLLALSGCASRGLSPAALEGLSTLDRADALFRAGCDACLIEALGLYEATTAAPAASRARATRGVFDTALLIALRRKELGLPAGRALARAETAATGLPTAETGAMLAAARAWPGNTTAFDNDERQKLSMDYYREQRSEDRPLRRALDAIVPQRLAVTYLGVLLDCGMVRDEPLDVAAILEAHDHAPLIRFRVAACDRGSADLFATLADADSRWAREVDFFSVTADMARSGRLMREAAERLTRAAAAFPESGAIRLALAGMQRGLRQLDDALTSYNTVLGLVPTQREALLGRVITLTYLRRPDEAVGAATRMIELGTWLIGDAHYWRAWNRFQLKQFNAAWEDAEQAIKLLANSSVFTLAGLIAYNRGDLDTAKDRFGRALQIDAANCEAGSYLGIVHAEQQAWLLAASAFASATKCFTDAARAASSDLAALLASDQPQDFKERQAAEFRTIVDDAERQGAMAAYNAGNAHARLGETASALRFLEVAAAHVSMRAKAEALREVIRKP